MSLNGVIQKNKVQADADETIYQAQIVAAGEEANLTAVTANAGRYVAIIIPAARVAEFNAASEDDKIKFIEVAKNTFQRVDGSNDYLTLFEEEYLKLFP